MDSTATEQLMANFPLQFKNGHTIDTLAFWCVKCGKVAHGSQVLGQISRMIPSAADVRASYCCSCGHSNSYRIRLKDDNSFMWLTDVGWREQRPQKLTRVTSIRQWCYRAVWFIKIKWICFLVKRNLMKFYRFINNNQ